MQEQSKHLVAVSALVKNENGHVLMVRTHLRADTWELPGGFVDAGESLEVAVCREFLEETGVVIRPHLKSRIVDALNAAHSIPYESWNLNAPDYKLLSRIDGENLKAKKVFLLTGRPRTGKSTMIKKLINEMGSEIGGGFYTEEITNNNDRIGFRCVSVDGESVEIANVESPSKTRIGRYGIDKIKFKREVKIVRFNESTRDLISEFLVKDIMEILGPQRE